jgi:hypothetical protein
MAFLIFFMFSFFSIRLLSLSIINFKLQSHLAIKIHHKNMLIFNKKKQYFYSSTTREKNVIVIKIITLFLKHYYFKTCYKFKFSFVWYAWFPVLVRSIAIACVNNWKNTDKYDHSCDCKRLFAHYEPITLLQTSFLFFHITSYVFPFSFSVS